MKQKALRLAVGMRPYRPDDYIPPGGNFPRVPTRARWRQGGAWTEVEGTAMAVPDTTLVVHTVHFTGLAAGSNVEMQIPAGSYKAVYTTYADDPCTTLVLHWITAKPQLWDYRLRDFSTAIHTSFTAPETLGAGGAFTMVHFSDSHGGIAATPAMVKAVRDSDPQVILHSGDVATTNGGAEGPRTLYELVKQLAQMRDSSGRIVPFLPNVGNHETWNGSPGIEWYAGGTRGRKPDWDTDTRADLEWYLCVFPTWPGMRGFGVLDFGNFCSVWQLNPGIYAFLDDPADSQVDWLETTLAARADVPHKIASTHYNFYEWGRRPFDPYMVAGRAAFGQRLFDGGCRTCFVGHAHVIGYSVPIDTFGPLDHQIEHAPAEIGAGLEIFGSGTPGVGMAREGKNPATKWWVANSMPSIIEYYDFEKPGWAGDPALAEPRDPHPDDGLTFPDADTAHYWKVVLRPDGRTVSAINSKGETWVTLERPVDPS